MQSMRGIQVRLYSCDVNLRSRATEYMSRIKPSKLPEAIRGETLRD